MKALALFSGGLDSTLAMKIIGLQGIEVQAIHVNFGFGGTKDKRAHLENMCSQVGAKLEILDLRDKYIKEVLFSPRYGYGSAFNPCIDCHGFMFRHTKNLLEKYKADFMISGEVVGQRPMSQRKEAMQNVQKLSLDEDNLILRPLCAKLLPETKPELEGWVDRTKLLDIEGRSRTRQIKLAEDFGIQDYEKPAGGCMLTEQNTAKRIKDFIKYDTLEVDDMNTLKYGRHLRLEDNAKLIIGRNEQDNKMLENTTSKKYSCVKILGVMGPYSLLDIKASKEDKELACKIILSYAKTKEDEIYQLKIGDEIISASKFASKDEFTKYFI